MNDQAQLPITQMLLDWSRGDKAALERMMPIVHGELYRLAHRYMNRERAGHTLQTSALVNEAYLRLVDQRSVEWQNRAHFFAIAAQMMRRILVDHAHSHKYAKRGAGAVHVSLEHAALISKNRQERLSPWTKLSPNSSPLTLNRREWSSSDSLEG
jgi:RNA polymerase sigma-70 factor, ECF subfamily